MADQANRRRCLGLHHQPRIRGQPDVPRHAPAPHADL
jgi:hypothetical protein